MSEDLHACGVCVELDHDYTRKASAKWCDVCRTYICDQCEPDLGRRAQAMVLVNARRAARAAVKAAKKVAEALTKKVP